MKEQITGIDSNYGDATFRIFHFSLSPIPELLPKHHTHQYYEILFCAGESVHYLLEDGEIRLKKNQYLILPPGVPHMADTEKGAIKAESIAFSLSEGKGKKGFYRSFEQTLLSHSLRPLHASAELFEALRALNGANWNGTPGSYCRLKYLAPAFLFALFDGLNVFDDGERATAMEHDREDTVALLDNLLNNQSLTLRDLSAKINYSERHTARMIRKQYGVSFSELRKRQRTL